MVPWGLWHPLLIVRAGKAFLTLLQGAEWLNSFKRTLFCGALPPFKAGDKSAENVVNFEFNKIHARLYINSNLNASLGVNIHKQDSCLFGFLTHLKLTTISAVFLVAFIMNKDLQNICFATQNNIYQERISWAFLTLLHISEFRICIKGRTKLLLWPKWNRTDLKVT